MNTWPGDGREAQRTPTKDNMENVQNSILRNDEHESVQRGLVLLRFWCDEGDRDEVLHHLSALRGCEVAVLPVGDNSGLFRAEECRGYIDADDGTMPFFIDLTLRRQ